MSGKVSSLDRDLIKRESGIHGSRWLTFHGGYFSDAAIGDTFIEVVRNTAEISKPGVIVDLGGGTGFILRELIRRSIDPGIRLVNVELSGKQLETAADERIVRIRRSITKFNRSDAYKGTTRFLFIMRSALHYLGRDGLLSFLCHLRSQADKGEFFVHQTACFDSVRDARCINRLYNLMAIDKWYPTTKFLCRSLGKAGWSVKSFSQAPTLLLTSGDLGMRYRLCRHRLMEIRENLFRLYGEKENVFALTPEGFRAYLHYRIFTCEAR